MNHPLLAVALLTSALLLSGCGGETPAPETEESPTAEAHHDHHHSDERPQTFSAAVTHLAELRDAIEAALEEDDLEQADGPVHEVGHVLEDLDGLAAKAGLTDAQQATVKEAQATLFAAYGALDETIHGKEGGKTWEQVSSDIDRAMASLQKLVATGETEGTGP